MRSVSTIALSSMLGCLLMSAASAADSDLDAGFGNGGVLDLFTLESDEPEAALAMLRDDQGRFLVLTQRRDPFPLSASRDQDLVLYRLLPSGLVDASYNAGAGYVLVEVNWSFFGKPRLDRQGRILVPGTIIDSAGGPAALALLRLLPTGARDSSFTGGVGNNGISALIFGSSSSNRGTAVALMPNDDLVLAGHVINTTSDMIGARLAAGNGAAVGSWGSGFGLQIIDVQPAANAAADSVLAAEALPDGRLLLLGQSCSAALGCRPAAVRLNAAGQLDASFCASSACIASSVTGASAGKRVVKDPALSGVAFTSVQPGAALRDDAGRLLFAAATSVSTPAPAPGLLLRLLADGDIDTAFGAPTSPGFQGLSLSDAPVLPRTLMLYGSARLLVGGTSERAALHRILLARLDANGILDTGFGAGTAIVEYFPSPASDDRRIADVVAQGARLLAVADGNGMANRDAFLFRLSSSLFADGFE